jgi:Rrf2 family protein
MVQISEAASLALHSMVSVAAAAERPVNLKGIACSTGISETHLAKVLQRLVKAGLLTSTRGPRGGFDLARSAKDIDLLSVYEAVEGPLGTEDCLLHSTGCPFGFRRCIFGGLLAETNTRFREYMKGTTLSDIIREE